MQSTLLVETQGGLNVEYNNKLLYSKYDSCGGAIKTVRTFLSTNKHFTDTLYIIPSPLLWFGIEELLSGLKNASVIAVEADPELLAIAQSHSPLLPIYSTEQFTNENLETIPGWPFRRVIFIPVNGGYRAQKDKFDRVKENISLSIRNYWRNKMTLLHMVPLWIRNIYKNLHNLPNMHTLSALHIQKPVILAGAGESLETLPDLISESRNNFFLLAIDTALPFLAQINLKPDGIIAVDGQYYNFLDFIGCSTFSDVPVIADMVTYPGVLRQFTGPKYMFLTSFWDTPLIKRLEKIIPDTLPAFGSVGIAGLEIAQRITDNYVFYCGLDFCFSLGKSHARGTTYGKLLERTIKRLNPFPSIIPQLSRGTLKVNSIDGSAKLSDKTLLGYYELAKHWGFDNSRVFTLSSKGLDIGVSMQKLPNTQPADSVKTDKKKSAQSGAFNKEIVENLIQDENNLLHKLYRSAYRVLEENTGHSQFFKAIEECDYPGLHITDMDPSRPHPIQLKRLLMAAALYIRTIEQCRDM